jgi:hypothetical protein
MEDVLDLYDEPYDPRWPTVCFDEKPVVLHADVQPPIPMAPGQAERIDYEYERQGTANLFVLVEPLAGRRHITVTERRTKQDYAQQLRWLVEEGYPDAEYIRVVQDNLNTHTPGALYETFPAAEARRIAQRLEWHYTPKHASWLNMAEIEISSVQRCCLRHRVGSMTQLPQHMEAFQQERNAKRCTIDWQFTSEQARQKLARLYPTS